MKKLVTPFRVGLLVIAAGAFFVTFVLFAREGGLSDSDSTRVWAYFRDASGLAVRGRVQIAGIRVGEIDDIILEGTRARVVLKIREDVDLREDAVVTKRSESLLGDYLLDLNPGTENAPKLENGGQIRRVIDTQGMEAIFESLSQITSDIQQVTGALREVLGGERGAGSLQRIVENLVRLSDSVDATVRRNADRLDVILANFEGVSTDVRTITQNNQADVGRIVDNIEFITRDVREVLASVKNIVGSGEGDFKESVASLKQTLTKLDSTLGNLEEITRKVKDGEGAAGVLLTDESVGREVRETVQDVARFAAKLTDLQTEVGIQSSYLAAQGRSKNVFSVRLIPKPDKYYLLELVDDPRGTVTTETVQTNPPSEGDPVIQTRKVTKESLRISAQFAKRWYFTTLRVGLIESTGGVGADLHLFDDALTLKMDAFNFAADELRYPRLRATLRAQAFDHLFVVAGMDDMLNAQQRDTATQRLIAGRDFFVGGGLFFTDDDLKAILTATGIPTP
ncbi:MlaD family protein [Myxococcus llanfairpwllgwyngyllgogerychwyrndrobwllllantysiliogogogochensis]|uniref:MCE family protein n=1 Tax=Myxococcus llanfairpwllgwyngyllgogerychwyrndrobwllllantysiliogogogochensis TaxID=2590453 RepID=A0A540WRZ3_9BACT|nr:MlaD family protein [Myxococcus llanfairpwllgwyngyllgogerychwyrndrobwllllantysiliogogogochensis]NTX06741.1 MCE family protein [Myxococcus sp. CA040A]NTX36796.1 MCE family protein [Myxococcus sp. CA033]TQF11785.1 MCE family protein [Myxococcus llanfairpwllgwyngyllgogerychwyrndrobwllllantysiliogogogochensis]